MVAMSRSTKKSPRASTGRLTGERRCGDSFQLGDQACLEGQADRPLRTGKPEDVEVAVAVVERSAVPALQFVGQPSVNLVAVHADVVLNTGIEFGDEDVVVAFVGDELMIAASGPIAAQDRSPCSTDPAQLAAAVAGDQRADVGGCRQTEQVVGANTAVVVVTAFNFAAADTGTQQQVASATLEPLRDFEVDDVEFPVNRLVVAAFNVGGVIVVPVTDTSTLAATVLVTQNEPGRDLVAFFELAAVAVEILRHVGPQPQKLHFGKVAAAAAGVTAAAAAATAGIAASTAAHTTGGFAASRVAARVAAIACLHHAILACKLSLDFGKSSFDSRVVQFFRLGLSQADEQARQGQRRPHDGRLHP